MKKIMILLVIITTIFLGCDDSKHLKYKGIEINGKLPEFVSNLEKLGFEKVFENGSECMMNFERTTVIVQFSKGDKGVYKVTEMFPPDESDMEWDSRKQKFNLTWSASKKKYNSVKKKTTAKYGKPSFSVFGFDTPYTEGDGREFDAIRKGKCMYLSGWRLSNGELLLGFHPDFYFTTLTYNDRLNSEKYGVGEIITPEMLEKVQKNN